MIEIALRADTENRSTYEKFLTERANQIAKKSDLVERVDILAAEIAELEAAISGCERRSAELLDQLAAGKSSELALEKIDTEITSLQSKLKRKAAIRDRLDQEIKSIEIAPLKEIENTFAEWMADEGVSHLENRLIGSWGISLDHLRQIVAAAFGIYRLSYGDYDDFISRILPEPNPQSYVDLQERYSGLVRDYEANLLEESTHG